MERTGAISRNDGPVKEPRGYYLGRVNVVSEKTVVKRSLLFTRRYTWSISDRWRLSVQPAEHRGTSEGLVIGTQINLEL